MYRIFVIACFFISFSCSKPIKVNLNALEELASADISKLDNKIKDLGYHFQSERPSEIGISRHYFSGPDFDRKSNNQLSFTVEEGMHVINFETADKSFYETLIKEIDNEGYVFQKELENMIGGKSVMMNIFQKSDYSIAKYQYDFEGTTIYTFMIMKIE